MEHSRMQSRIDGEFNGWEGETLIKLANGQVWQQTEYWYYYHYAYRPMVSITNEGGYKMQIEGVPQAVRVVRLV
jgi:hypothetical protein